MYPQENPAHHQLSQAGIHRLRNTLFGLVDFSHVHRILDFGCGYGSDVLNLAKRYPHLQIQGLTLSTNQAKVGQQKIQVEEISDRVNIQAGNSAKEIFEEKFDLMLGLEVVHHNENKEVLFSNLAKQLDNNGEVLLADFISQTNQTIQHEETSSYFETPERWSELLANEQLQINRIIDVTEYISHYLADPDFESNLSRAVKQDTPAVAISAIRSYAGLGQLLAQKPSNLRPLQNQKSYERRSRYFA